MKTLNHDPVAKAQMLIRRPVAEVFAAFVDPSVTTKFWFTKSSGRLDLGKDVRWDWEMYGVSTDVHVKAIEENKRIVIEWTSYNVVTTVEWIFAPRSDNETFVVVTDSGFEGDGDEIVKNAIESTGGFNIVLCGMKALLEHGVVLNLIPDVHPDALVKR